ncbi:MAG: outer membrane protein transport protein [Prevotellaceae bacterium]|nr:outer membrane protein transport protein [Prevotellaceae bacterium]
MKRILYTAIAVIILSTTVSFAQDRYDAMRWSQYFYDGTARFAAMGGAFGALGGDFASLSVNPAGIGVYRAAEFSLNPSYLSTSTKSSFTGLPSMSRSKSRGDFNFGYVQPFILSNDKDDLISINLGLGYNTMTDYHYDAFAYNKSGSSWLDALTDKMENNWEYFDPVKMEGYNRYDNFGAGDWDAVLAWNSALVSEDSIGFYNALHNGDIIEQRRLVESRGRNSEFVFSLGGNYANTLFFGMTIGIQDIEYKKYLTYVEDVVQTTEGTDLKWFDYRQFFETEGSGINIRLGLLYRVNDNWRLGLAVHTPTWMNLTDYYSASIQSEFQSDDQYYMPDKTPWYEYKYKVSTPARYNLSAAYLFSNIGAVSVDYEYVDYSTIKMRESEESIYGNTFDKENDIIKDEFAGASNIRIGVEVKPVNNFAIRAGYAFYGSPYKESVGGSPSTQIYSFGLGYRIDNFFVDAAYKYLTSKSGLYDIYNGSNTISEQYVTNQIALTFGFRF